MDCVQGVYPTTANRAALAALYGFAPSVSARSYVRAEDCRRVAAGGKARLSMSWQRGRCMTSSTDALSYRKRASA
jgi:hypothetical protein